MNTFTCPACRKEFPQPKISDVQTHLNQHKIFGQLRHPIACVSGDCRSTVEKVESYVKHFEKYHLKLLPPPKLASSTPLVIPSTPPFTLNKQTELELNSESIVSSGENVENSAPQDLQSFSENMLLLQECLKVEATNMLVDLRSRGNVPLKVSGDVLKYVSNFIDLIVDKTCSAFETELHSFEAEGLQEVVKNITKSFKGITSILPSLGGSEYRIRKTCEKNPRFVAPEPLCLGFRHETVLSNVNGQSKVRIVSRPNNAQYVSIEKTLRAEMLDPEIRKLFLQKPVVKDCIYDSFHSGTRCNKQPCEFCNPSKNVIVIQLFFDGLGITNFARDAAKLHNSGMFYFSVLNLPPRFNAALSSIHLVAMCNTLDMKNGGLNIIAEKIVTECNNLTTNGMLIESEDGPVKVFVTVSQFTGDNLGLNQIFGFIESFSADFCCIICYATREDMRTYNKESDFKLRTRVEYESDLSKLDDLPPDKIHFRGVKSTCLFNELMHFHVCENWLNDPMHTLTEGVNPQVTGNVLHSISKIDSNVTVENFNREMSILFNGLIVDRHNRPCMLNKFLEPDNGISPKQSAAQQMVLCRYTPYILLRLVKNEACFKYIDLLVMLQKITDLVFAPQLTETLLYTLTELISDFISLFKNLYPNSPIRPKLHFLVHYPSIIRKNGPPRTFWCMNYERMNGAVKIPSHVMKNFKDPQKTLAYRRQYAALNSRLERRGIRDFVKISSSYVESITDIGLPLADNYASYLNVFESDSVLVTNKIVVNGTEYREGTLVIVCIEKSEFVFGKILFVVCEIAEKPLLFVTLFDVLGFQERLFCYKIRKRSPFQVRLCEISSLVDPLPLDVIKENEANYVRLKYHVLKTPFPA